MGNVGVGVADPSAKLDVSGPMIRAVARIAGYGYDDRDSGPLLSRLLTFVKTRDETAIRVGYVDNLAVLNASSCRYEIRFNEVSCMNPGGLYFDIRGGGANPELVFRSNAQFGTCFGLSSGTYSIQVFVGTTPLYPSADCYTNVEHQYWSLEAEEVR